ncbi:hypothetical protein HN587_05395 [Candidatus Woesearchaeota archaeon]|jgi:hypothetical protein|nr:hypothetical protein [Candidatus Woesearchaeota archaeon]
MADYPQGMPPGQGYPQGQPMPQGNMPPPPAGYPPQGDPGNSGADYGGGENTEERIEELVEAIIDEKWKELTANISRIIDWKDKTEARITKIEADFQNLKDNFDKLHTGILEKVGEYDHHIMDVGTEVKALEKVFQKVLPGFLDNINELSRITDDLKKIKK